MKRRYPRADALGGGLIEDRRVVSAGGPLSWIDLALHVIRTLCWSGCGRTGCGFRRGRHDASTQAVYIPAGIWLESDPSCSRRSGFVRHAGGRSP